MNGFIIVNYNDYQNTINLIKNIIDYKIIEHIVVVDNCSTDNSREMLKNYKCDKICIIESKYNGGYGAGINLACKFLKEKFNVKNVIISNTDIKIKSENDLKKMLKYLNKKNIALVGPVIIENNNLNKRWNKGWKIPTIWNDIFLNIPFFNRILYKKMLLYNEKHYDNEISYVEVVRGCFFAMKIDVLEEIGYFDENIFLYYEENVIATKLKNKKFKSIIVNDVEIFHKHSVTIDKNLTRIEKNKELKKSQRYFHENYSKGSKLELLLLDVINKLVLCMIYFVYLLKGCFVHK